MTGKYMTDDKEVAGLLQESIDAQNRTTHAVRAFVRFFFIQLVAATIALPLVYFGTILVAPGLVLIAFLVLVVGIVWSSSAGWSELGLSDRYAAERQEARQLRRARAEADRAKAALARETVAVARREARRELFASKRFRVMALVGAGVALIAVTAGTVFVQTTEAERVAGIAASEAESADQLADLQATYLGAVDDCASSVGVGDVELGTRYSIKDATLVLNYELGLLSGLEDDYVDCVVFALTDDGASDIDRGVLQERGLFTLSRGESGATLTIRPRQ
jgi:uncharacterized membrane protein